MGKQDLKIEEMQREGWNIHKDTEQGMNQKYYRIVIMKRGDEIEYINNRGGNGGIAVTAYKCHNGAE